MGGRLERGHNDINPASHRVPTTASQPAEKADAASYRQNLSIIAETKDASWGRPRARLLGCRGCRGCRGWRCVGRVQL